MYKSYERPSCTCGDACKTRGRELLLHAEQDTSTNAWKRLLEIIEDAAVKQLEDFAPGESLDHEDWHSIVTLPASIAKLKSVTRVFLYGSSLVRLPPEIGEMSALQTFVPYTSYRLHSYEITRCKNLKLSSVSTRALYGNYIGLVMEAAVGQWSAEPLVKEEKQESDLDGLGGKVVAVAGAVPLKQVVTFQLAEIVTELVQAIGVGLKAGR